LGAFFTFFFADLLGRKKTLIMLIPANIILYFLFGFCIIANYYFMMIILIISGFFNYIIMITMIIYICEIVEHESIPIFICLLVSGLPISGMFTYFFYNIKIKNWQKITIYLAIADIFIYLLILLFII
jgi:MFS family permease